MLNFGHHGLVDLETVEGDRVRNAAVTADDFDGVKIKKHERPHRRNVTRPPTTGQEAGPQTVNARS
jgi:hypothetical protein